MLAKGASTAPDGEITSVARKGDASRAWKFGVVRLSVLTILQLPITSRALRGEVSSRGQTFYRLRFTAYDEYCRAEYCDFVEEKTRFIREKL